MQYPDSLPLTEIKLIIDRLRSGTVDGHLDEFAHAIWVVQGYAQKMLIGEAKTETPDAPDFELTAQTADTSEQAIQALERAIDKRQELGEGEIVTQAAIPWSLILKFLLEILEERLG
ncbi:hypothetical protein [Rhodopirellula halodulae]|uniref:hypothetical protein n=1 Tax=Rhodopirellula halodulae TaxID=2894198 RepID=UPI001E45BBBB|nr:hypothetical protein [Rhodopirellula sp. JC737]MCC9655294.1 hypothetical protein [Rhodopirellula sp. JC737]